MDNNFVFRFGKHSGKTYGWVEDNDPSYIKWAREKAPNLLKPPKPKAKQSEKKEVKFRDKPLETLQPNMNFYNEGPDEISIPYLKKMEELKKKY